jgi:hypothetical protein
VKERREIKYKKGRFFGVLEIRPCTSGDDPVGNE